MRPVIAIIPARGGSKGIPRKNLVRVGGTPLVVRSVRHALASDQIDRVYVTTQDAEIARVAEAAGAELVQRPDELAGDTASTESAITHALADIAGRGVVPETIVLLQCTSPFRSDGQLDAALSQFAASGSDSMLSVTPFHGFAWRRESVGHFAPLTYEPTRRPRRQEIDDVFLETGSFYIFRRSMYETENSRLGGRIEPFVVPASDALDIDVPEDLARARAWARTRPAELAATSSVRWIVLDVDGTLTDGALYYGDEGGQLKRFNARDAAGIGRWRAQGGKVAVVTEQRSLAARKWARSLGVDHIVMGCDDKVGAVRRLLDSRGLAADSVLAMGDDVDDLEIAKLVGWFSAPANAAPPVLAAADLVVDSRGGEGAVREVIDILLRARPPRTLHAAA